MSIEQIIYDTLKDSVPVNNIFNGNIFPLTGSNGKKLPILLYQIYQVEAEATKKTASLKDTYLLKLNIFSEDYADVVNSISVLKVLFDNKTYVDIDDNILIDLIRFDSYTDEFQENSEVHFRTMNFNVFVFTKDA
ncbi:hypothetical protein [Cyclobacterium plantarum]|uniref:DUF3168 domain-containing protein n=1 Tax=Cyclobacterium plantarum TaxID=2716263 RepID=A0ABX0HBZ8_9BACT|nr:hypothetical protein [Cyclobacterium plantarum]NHE57956.1 hypothetical protein [Cyclobacterium plantarum]